MLHRSGAVDMKCLVGFRISAIAIHCYFPFYTFFNSGGSHSPWMAHKKTAYVDFSTSISGIETAIRIFETETHCFVYVNQFPVEMHLYNDPMKAALQNSCARMNRKEFTVICNLSTHEALDAVAKHLAKVLNE